MNRGPGEPTQRPVVQGMLIVSLLGLSWLWMQIVHELGHALAAVATGGTVLTVYLHPLEISRTDVSPNPSPLAVVWAGPIVGSLLPIGIWCVMSKIRRPTAYLWRFFAGFCLIANGAYIGCGSFLPVGDAEVMRSLGSPVWLLASFGLMLTPADLWCWHGQGADFGLGPAAKRVNWRHAAACLALLVATVSWELLR